MARTVAMRTASGGLRELRPRLLTSAFVMVAVAELAYFTRFVPF